MIDNRLNIDYGDFEEHYIALRQKEQRIYSDAEVRLLPVVSKEHPHYREWQTRHYSCSRLLQYLAGKRRPLSVLEVGCGNGWLSAKISGLEGVTVTAIDVNAHELNQAKRVFNSSNLQFIRGSLDDLKIGDRFDVILFAASLQYFSSVHDILSMALRRLHVGGEIHIVDTFFYNRDEVLAAQRRSALYYDSIGFPEMKNHYFHHCIDDLNSFNYKTMYNPYSLGNRWSKTLSPFYWICVRNSKN